jgi:NADH:ubiquinone oxidoreductase subunit D
MTFDEWASQRYGDGVHSIDALPLDALHPLRHGFFALSLEVQAGMIEHCRFDVHANHRGDEKLLEVRDVRQGLALIDRHGWLTAPHAEVLFARIIESMLGITISPRAAALRELVLQLNRAAVDALWYYLEGTLSDTADGGALDTREAWLSELEELTGARMHSTYARIGGVGEDIHDEQLARLVVSADPRIAAAAHKVSAADGALAVTLPKVVRIPHTDEYGEIATPHGTLGMWIVGRGDKVPHRVHLRTAGFTSLSTLERDAVGMTPYEFFMRLARTRLVLGEVSR